MARQLFTAADIRRIHSVQKSDVLLIGPADLITPEAVDLAQELGVRLVREEAPAALANGGRSGELPPLRVVHRGEVTMDPFGQDLATPGTNVRLKDVITSRDGAPVAAGYMALERGEFPWTLTYDEVDIVLEGELVITRGAQAVHGLPGDTIFIPKGSKITFGTPSFVHFVYVTYPADWGG
jgi:ethanolamine utilization protein EutQ